MWHSVAIGYVAAYGPSAGSGRREGGENGEVDEPHLGGDREACFGPLDGVNRGNVRRTGQ